MQVRGMGTGSQFFIWSKTHKINWQKQELLSDYTVSCIDNMIEYNFLVHRTLLRQYDITQFTTNQLKFTFSKNAV